MEVVDIDGVRVGEVEPPPAAAAAVGDGGLAEGEGPATVSLPLGDEVAKSAAGVRLSRVELEGSRGDEETVGVIVLESCGLTVGLPTEGEREREGILVGEGNKAVAEIVPVG